MVFLLILFLFFPLLSHSEEMSRHPANPQSTDMVVLVHGMGRTPFSMMPMEYFLKQRGFRVINFGYSSYGPSIADIGADLARELTEELGASPAPRVHFVGHSLGNIIVRWLLAHDPPKAQLGRFVMLAPPNQGAAIADRLTPYIGWLLKPIAELRTQESTVTALPVLKNVEFAVVAGENDGKVSLAEACLPGAKAFIVVPAGHTFILMAPQVLDLVHHFLEYGDFPQPPPVQNAGSCHQV